MMDQSEPHDREKAEISLLDCIAQLPFYLSLEHPLGILVVGGEQAVEVHHLHSLLPPRKGVFLLEQWRNDDLGSEFLHRHLPLVLEVDIIDIVICALYPLVVVDDGVDIAEEAFFERKGECFGHGVELLVDLNASAVSLFLIS
jgi:hypothetical protein